MPVERTFIKLGLKRVELDEFLARELERAGYGGADIRRIPTGTRVALYVERPGMVIGRKGKSIKHLTDELAQKFGLENPQVEVVELTKPELCAPIMAKRIAFALERGISARRVGHTTLRRIMNAGARGAEVKISGRIAGERTRTQRFYQGYLSKAGEPAEKLVSHGYAAAKLKPGIAGVKVLIMPPDVPLPDDIKIAAEETPKPEEVVPAVGAGEGQEKAKAVEGEAKEVKPEEGEESGDTQTQ
ncbi:MAG: 30S ribosomal protein S3 [Hadesarchaea archaeon]|nr:30S ribosomal protein S3 [Hadesarchaea archaeon]MDH5685674.1 30S ribosomal protein S3 [Hadesarchaea archaeon]